MPLETKPDASTGEMVTVICRLPHGIHMRLYDEKDLSARVTAGYPAASAPNATASVLLNGANRDPRYHPVTNNLIGMGGRTEVPKDFWEAWKKQNVDFSPLKNGLIFAAANERRAVDELNEKRTVKTGFEGTTDETLKKTGVDKLDRDEG